MILTVQIKSLVMSFLYGIFMSFMFNLLYNFLFTKYLIINIFSNMMFSLLLFGIYFLLLFNINEGVIHTYFFIALFLGFYLYNKIFVKLRVKLPKTMFN